MIPLILDHQPGYLDSAVGSLLTVPVGARSLLSLLFEQLGPEMSQDAIIVPTFRPDRAHADRLAACVSADVRIVGIESLPTIATGCEPSDYLLVIEPSRFPLEGFDPSAFERSLQAYRGVTHAVAVGTDDQGIRERVECDASGQVRLVQRLYDRANWPAVANTAVFLSRVPVHAIRDESFETLVELRALLAKRGVMSQDLPVEVDTPDLSTVHGLLMANERMAIRAASCPIPPGFVSEHPDLLIGTDARVHASVRLVGSVIVHPGASVDMGVTIIGPTVLGAGSRVGQGAVIAQSVLLPDAVVADRVTIRHHVVSGHVTDTPPDATTSDSFERSSSADAGGLSLGGAMGASSAGPAVWRGRRFQLACKRVEDVVVALAGLIAISPIMLLAGLLVKLTSRGPLLFSHRREQRNGKEFPCLKFRTMQVDAHRRQRELSAVNEVDGPQFKITDDPRVTAVGRLLRATNIDELPQLFNVLAGHMSLVGPRPSPFRENQICVPWRRARLSVRPGITGLWQVCRAHRSRGDFNQWVYYDIAYVRHLSMWLDIKILIATVLTLGGRWSVPLSWVIRSDAKPDSDTPAAVVT